MHGMSHRTDFDGLRAVCVIAVVVFHYDASLLPGGFVGVDVFFVISGYVSEKKRHEGRAHEEKQRRRNRR